jgi:DNA-binding MarR family transcriptional regulator
MFNNIQNRELFLFRKITILIYYVNITYQYNKMKDVLYLKDEQIKDFIEKLFFAYRETFSDPKKIIAKYSFGIAHHKTIHLIDKYEGITVSGLLRKLKVTKQSLNRVLKDLSKKNFVIAKKGEIDSRNKHLFLSKNGKKIADEIFVKQKKRIYQALKSSDSQAVINFKEILEKIVNG